MKKTFRITFKIFAVFLMLYFVSLSFIASYMGFFAGKSSLKKNYDKRSEQIASLYDYISNIVADGNVVYFERGLGGKIYAVTENGRWEARVGSKEAEPLMRELAWTDEHINNLKTLMKKAKVVSVTSKNPDRDNSVYIGYSRSGLGYMLFERDLSEEQQDYYTGYGNTFYQDNVVFAHNDWWD